MHCRIVTPLTFMANEFWSLECKIILQMHCNNVIQDFHQNSTEFVYPFKLFCKQCTILQIKLCTQSFKSFGAIDS